MSSNLVFVDRRNGQDRRSEENATRETAPETTNAKKRKSVERRDRNRSIMDDYHAYMRKYLGKADYVEPLARKKPTEEA